MKKFINKHLAVILSLAIVLCTVLPVFSVFVKADGVYDAAVITELKEAWSALTIKKTLLPSGLYDGTPLTLNETSSYQGADLTDKTVLGDKYITYTLKGGDAADTVDRITFTFPMENTTLKIGDIKDFTVYVKSTGSNAIRPFFCVSTGARCNNSSIFNLTANNWAQLKMSNLPQLSTLLTANGALGGIKDRVVTGVDFDFNSTGDITVGSMVMEFYTVTDETLALATSDVVAFVEAANDFNEIAVTNGYFEATDAAFIRFTAALNATKTQDTEAQKLQTLKDAWSALTIKKTLLPSGLYNGTALTLNDASAYAGADLADKTVLGDKYITHTLAGGDAADTVDRITFTFPTENTTLKIGDIKDFTVYVKSTGSNAIRPYFCVSTGARCNNSSIFNLTANNWAQLKMSNLPQLSTLLTANGALGGIKDRVVTGVDFDFNSTGDITVGSMIVEFYAVDDATLALMSTDADAFVAAADAFYQTAVINNYYADDDAAFLSFTSALNAAKGEETPEQKLENLKKAWGEMYIADSLMSPTIEKVSGTNTQSTVYSTADGINNLPAGITAEALGSNYAYHKNVFESTGTAENRFMWSKATSGTGVEMSNADLSVYDDLTVSFYVEQVATAGTFSIDLYTQGKTVDVANTTYNITKADEGKWITLHGDDMRVNGFDELISKMAEVNNGSYRLYFFQFGLGSNATKFKGYFGSLIGIKNAVVPDLDGAELVAAAMDLDLTNYKNTAAFVTALDAAKEIFATDVAVDELKTAWEALVIKKTLLPTGLFDGTKFTLKDSSTYEGTDLADKSLLGDKYITHTLTGGSGSDTIDRVTFTFTEENTTLKTGQLKDFSVYVKTTGTNALIPFFMNPLGHRCNAASQFNAAAIGTNRWSQLKMSNLPQQDILWSSTALGAVTDRLVTGVDFDFNNTGDITVGSMTMEFYAVDAKTLALAGVNPSAFIIAAKNFYYEALSNDYFAENDEAFNDFVTALDAVKDYEGLFEAAVDSLAEAYGDLTIEEALVPSGLYDGTKFTLMDASTYEGTDLADKSVLGDKYIVHNLAGGTGADAIDRVTFTFARTGAEYTYGQLKDFGVYVKTTGTNALIPFFMNPNGQRVNAASQFNAAAIGTNRWTQLKMSNLPQQDVLWSSTALGAVTDRLITGVDFDFNSTGEVTIGTMFMELKAASDEIIALKDTDVSLFIANALSFADKAERENLFDANDAGYAKFENLLTILKSIEGNEELLTIAELQAAWLSLSDNSTFPETDTTNWDIADWVYAANRVDISGLTNTEAFVEALEKATALRDALGMEFSCNTSTYANSDDAKLHIQGLGENIISNLVPTVYYFDGTDRVEVTDVQYANFLDSDFETVTSVATENGGNGAYVEFIYRYDGMADITDFLVGSSVNEPLGKYRIYVADTIDKLADANSIVVSFDNTAAEQVQIFNFDGKPDVSGTYIALRVYTDGNSVNIGEFGVHGQYLKYGIQTGSFTNEQMAALGESLLANEDTVAYIKGATGAKTKWAQANMGYNVENLTDCKNDTVIGVGGKGAVVKTEGEETTFHIFFDLKETYYIKQLLINHFRQPHLQTGKYEVYASTDYATLFKSSSKVLSYNNMVDGPNGTTETQLFTAMGDGVIARYVSFCIKVPINDYDKSLSWYPSLCYPRLNDLAVYGERYYKPLKEVNFLGHMPVDVYRADAGGNKSTITEDEYDGLDYLNAADGIYDVATPIAQNGKNIDFVFNLCANKSINSVKLSTLTENVRGLKVYAAEDLDSVWSNEALVVDYYNINADSKEISKTFGETPIYARYIRFSITDTVSGTFDPTEFEVIGWNNQEFIYMNLAEERSENSSIWLEDKDTYDFAITSSKVGKYNTPWLDEDFYDFMYAFDGDPASVADLYSGSRGNADGTGRVTLNILVDLTSLNAVDNINFKSGGTKDYWPSEINFYLGEDDLSLFGKDAEPIKEFTSKTTDEDGNYSYTFLPEIAQYVRIEIVEGTQRYFEHINKIGAVISEIQVNGLEIVGFTASEGVAASVTDEETGIRADVVAIRDNDVFSKVQDILVIKRAATAEEKAAVKAQGIAFASDVYDIYLLDSGGNLISDVEGREIRICLPKSLFNGEGDPYVLLSSYGEFNMVDFVVEDDYYIATVAEPFGMVFAFCEFITDDEEAEDDDTADDMDNTLEDEDETETEDEEPEEEEDETSKKKRKKVKVVRKGNGTDISDYLWIIIVVVAVVIVAAGITLFIILAKKKKKREEEA